MTKLALNFACWGYDRMQPLADGRVQPDGIDLNFHDLEVEKVWKRVWQMACRVEQIPEAGDCVVYESPGASILIVRNEQGSIRAFYNSCLHRGMKLCTHDTSMKKIENSE